MPTYRVVRDWVTHEARRKAAIEGTWMCPSHVSSVFGARSLIFMEWLGDEV